MVSRTASTPTQALGSTGFDRPGQDAALAALRAQRGFGTPTADILEEAGGFVDPAAGTAELLVGPRTQTVTVLGQIREKLTEMRAPTLSEPDER